MTERIRECPKCNCPMEHQGDDPDVGIVGGWFCTNDDCGHTEDHDYDEDQ